ncbi:MAG: sodium-dependent transporter [Rhodothermales bacterium]|jgi:neurotransmitter:Na+ symporter, NSS family|nr:sodium-dependent transporter [Rhodothermales bacterium]MDG2017036.1 sodium-dependent transporter [Rhodothermales bacterium]
MSAQLEGSTTQRFSSRWGFFLSVLGIAVGTGNIWRFPRIAAQNGGDEGAGAFLVAWLVFLFAWSIPLIIVEYVWGRKHRVGVVATFLKEGGERFAWMGAFVAFVATAITFFYSVVVGWCIYYLIQMVISPLPTDTETAMAVWNDYQSGGWPLLFHAIAMGLGALAIGKGVKSIEKVNKVLVPTLLIIVVISVVRALMLPGAWDGVAYLFTPEWSQLSQPKIWIEALTQNAWDTGAGWGLFLTYAAYMSTKQGVVKNAIATAVGNNTVSLMAALMVFATVFAVLQSEMGMNQAEILEVMKTSGPASTGLTFIWMPQLFARMFMGGPLAILFFLGLTFAGFSSLIAQLELPTRVFIDAGMNRPRAIGMVVGISYLLGIPSAINLNILSNQDFVWGVALMVSGFFVSIIVIRNGVSKMREQYLLGGDDDWRLGKWWVVIVNYFIPVAAVTLLVWFLSQSIGANWYDPFEAGSLMTLLAQWAVMLGLFYFGNRWIVSKMSD